MPQLNLEGWVTPEQTFEGLYRIGDDIRANKRLANQEAYQKQQLAQREEAQKNATSTYLQGYLNPKHFLTGTNFDPVITTDLAGVLQKAMGLASQGLDSATITYSISPDVQNIAEGSERVKALENQRKQTLAQIRATGIKGIDYDKFNTEFKKAYAYDNGKLMSYSNVDVDRTYGDEVLKNADVFNNEGLKEFVAKSGKETTSKNAKVIGRDGRMRQIVADVTKPDFMVEDIDPITGAHKGFVPKYEIATDEDNQIVHDFGEQGIHPVRLLDQAYFDQLMHEVGSGGFIRQEVRRLTKDKGVDINSPQGELLARAIAYDELNDSGKKYSSFKERSTDKAAPERPYSFYHGSSKDAADVPTIDAFRGLKNAEHFRFKSKMDGRMVEDVVLFDNLPDITQNAILKVIKEINPYATLKNTYFKQNPDGTYDAYSTTTQKPFTTLTEDAINQAANQSLGVKSKVKSEIQSKEGDKLTIPASKRVAAPTHKTTSKGIKIPVFK